MVARSIIFQSVELQYLGNWYQQQGNPTFYQPADAQCVRATYGANGKKLWIQQTLDDLYLIIIIFLLILQNYFLFVKLLDDGTVSVHNIDTNPKGEVEEVHTQTKLDSFGRFSCDVKENQGNPSWRASKGAILI